MVVAYMNTLPPQTDVNKTQHFALRGSLGVS